MFLVEAGADVNAKNAIGTTPLDAAYADNSFASGEDLDANSTRTGPSSRTT